MKARTMRRIYLREAVCILFLVTLAARLVRPEKLFAWARRPPRRIRRFASEEIHWVSWAFETIDAKRWLRTSSASRALAAQAMLRRRGISSRLCFGVARNGQALVTHAWVEVGQTDILGRADASRSTRLVALGEARR
jgi:Transglutaminase-like superfamily